MDTTRRGFVGGGVGAGSSFRFVRGVCAEEVRRRRQRHRDQDRQYQSLQRPGLVLRRDRQDDRCLFQEHQRFRRRQRPQDQVHLARRRLQPAQDGGNGPPARRAGQDLRALPVARHAVQHGDPQVHEPEKGAAALRRHRRVEVGRPQELSVDHGLPARLSHRRRDLRQAHPGQRQGRQDRRAAPERRLRPRLPRRLQGRPGQGDGPHRQGGDLRGDRSDGRQPDHPAQGLQAPTSSSTWRGPRPLPRASARQPTSTGSRRTTSTTCRRQSPR